MTTTTLHGTIHVERSMIINRPPDEVYRFWRDFTNLPRFMQHLQSVEVQDGRRSHWITKAPAGTTVEWDAEVIHEIEDDTIAWQSVGETNVPNAGSVRFLPADGGQATEVKITLNYDPPAGKFGDIIAKLFGEAPDQQVRDDLRRLKQLLEAGETATIEGQPRGRCKR
ncbi:MAG: hypothetical protein AMXMBFR13_00850 [Phycisphaerae bacterium]|jgi:uncharacterized membrane protein